MEFVIEQAKRPKMRKRAPLVPTAVQSELKRYAAAYRVVYKREPLLTYTKPYIFIDDQSGVNLKRLTELTRMLRERAKDL